MRLFIGLRPSDEFRTALTLLQSRLQSAGICAGYQAPSNLHMTLAFIGDWPENVSGVLPEVTQPFPLTLSKIGIFPEAKVIWAGVEPSEKLDLLAEQVRNSLAESDIRFDRKPFVPHITLGRKPVVPPGFRFSDIAVPKAVMEVKDVYVYRSDRRENGMVYSVIGSASEKGDGKGL